MPAVLQPSPSRHQPAHATVVARVAYWQAKIVLEPAKLVLMGANGVLEGVKQTMRAGLDAVAAIASLGLGGIIDVRKASFEVELSVADGGAFQAELEISMAPTD